MKSTIFDEAIVKWIGCLAEVSADRGMESTNHRKPQVHDKTPEYKLPTWNIQSSKIENSSEYGCDTGNNCITRYWSGARCIKTVATGEQKSYCSAWWQVWHGIFHGILEQLCAISPGDNVLGLLSGHTK